MMEAACVFGENVPNADCHNGGDSMKNDAPVSPKIAVEVDNDYRYISQDKLLIYFGKTKNGGGDIKSLIYPYEYKGRNVAVIEFEDSECVEALITKQAVIPIRGNECVTLNISKFEELMTNGSINLNRSLYERMKSTFADAVDDILDDCDVVIDEDACLMTGDWYKMSHAKKRLDALMLNEQPKTVPQNHKMVAEQSNADSDVKDQTCLVPADGSNPNDTDLESISSSTNTTMEAQKEIERSQSSHDPSDFDKPSEQDKTSMQLANKKLDALMLDEKPKSVSQNHEMVAEQSNADSDVKDQTCLVPADGSNPNDTDLESISSSTNTTMEARKEIERSQSSHHPSDFDNPSEQDETSMQLAKKKLDVLMLDEKPKTVPQNHEMVAEQSDVKDHTCLVPAGDFNPDDTDLGSISSSTNATMEAQREIERKASQSSHDLSDFDNPSEQDETSMQLAVNCHMLGYMKMTDGGNLLQMITDYDIQKDEAGDDTVILKFPKYDVAKDGKKRIEDMLGEAERNSFKETYDPMGCSDNKINQVIEVVRREFQKKVYVCSMNEDSRRSILFIGPTKDVCDSAISVFKSAMCDEPTTSSDRVDENEDSSVELMSYEFCDNALVLRILQGNIVDQNATAIVNAANEHLHDGGGVTGAIYNAGGNEFRSRCHELMKQRNFTPLGMGEVVETKACGKLRCKSVLHAVAPNYYQCKDEVDCQKKMQLTCYQIFFTADSMQFESVSIPAMGTGIYGVPIKLFCKALARSIKEICEDISKGRVTSLKEIRLVNYDKYEARQIVAGLSQEDELLTVTGPVYGDDIA